MTFEQWWSAAGHKLENLFLSDELARTIWDTAARPYEDIYLAINPSAVERPYADDLRAAVVKLLEDLKEANEAVDLRYKASMEALEAWRAEDPERNLLHPDHKDLVVWLLDKTVTDIEGDPSPNADELRWQYLNAKMTANLTRRAINHLRMRMRRLESELAMRAEERLDGHKEVADHWHLPEGDL